MKEQDTSKLLTDILCTHFDNKGHPILYLRYQDHLEMLQDMYDRLQRNIRNGRKDCLTSDVDCQRRLEQVIRENRIQTLTSPMKWVRELAQEIHKQGEGYV